MCYFKMINSGYIVSLATASRGEGNITEEEYNEILSVIENKPEAPDGYEYKLREDLTWELVELPPMPEPEATPEELAKALEGIL